MRTMEKLLAYIDEHREEAIARLSEYLAIPSVSTDAAHADDIRKAAEWTRGQLEACGLEAAVESTAGHPAVVGRTPDKKPDRPTVLFYGHYDVQPPDPVEKWRTPPFEPTIRDGAIYARGASDDKGQVACFLEALRAWHEVAGECPVNLIVLIEGEEEIGSANLPAFLEAQRKRFDADVAVVSDTAMWNENTPAITYALRGLLYFDIQLHGPSRDLHSGVYGGTVANPATELALVLGQLFDADHRVTIPGFYDDVAALDEAERRAWEQLNFDERAWAASVGLDALHGEAGFSTLERRWARPSCDVNGLYGGYMAEGAKTVIPSYAGAKVSFRLAADQQPDRIAAAFRDWLERRTPPGCRWRIREHGRAHPVRVSTDSPHLRAAERAMQIGCGAPPVLVREGATIPVVATFRQLLGIDTILMGFGRHDDAIHSPNEKFELANFERGARSHAALLRELSELKSSQ